MAAHGASQPLGADALNLQPSPRELGARSLQFVEQAAAAAAHPGACWKRSISGLTPELLTSTSFPGDL